MIDKNIEELSDFYFHNARHEKDNSFLLEPINTWDKVIGFREESKSTLKSRTGTENCLVMFEDKNFDKYWVHIPSDLIDIIVEENRKD